MERDQIEESKNRSVHNSGTIAAHVSMFEERKHRPPGFSAKKQTPIVFPMIPAIGALHFCVAEDDNSDMDFHAA